MEHVEYVYTRGMTEDEVAAALRDEPVGVLSLASDGDAYAVPVAHEYVDGRVRLRLSRTGDDRKLDFLDDTRTACFVVYGADPDWSVIVEGPLEEAETPTEREVNEAYPPFPLFDQSVSEVAFEQYDLVPERIAGRAQTD